MRHVLIRELRMMSAAFAAVAIWAAGSALAVTGGFDPKAFNASVAPFLAQHCIKCHGPEKQESDLRLDVLDADLINGRNVQTWNDVRAALLAGDMPPAKQPRPSLADTQQVVNWLTEGLRANGKVTLRQPPDFNHPRFGNRVDHEALFHPRPGTLASSPARAWRLSSFGYTQMASGLISLEGRYNQIIAPFGGGAEPGFRDYSALMQIDEPTINQLLNNAREIVEYQTTPLNKKGRQPAIRPSRELTALADGSGAPSVAEMEAGIRLQFQSVLQRSPTREEAHELVDLMTRNIKVAGRDVGVRMTLAGVLLLPEVLYRLELGESTRDAAGRSRLTPSEIAVAISYALGDRRQDASLVSAAEQGRLKTAQGVGQEVQRLLNDSSYAKPRILRFFQEYFGYPAAVDVFKNASDFREHGPVVLVDDTDRLIEYVLGKDKNVLYELLTTRKSYVGWLQKPGVKRNSADSIRLKGDASESYCLAARPDDSAQPVDMPADQRMGILTQPSWLVAFSENTDNNAILRGKWIRERLLGGTIPDLPITVNAMLPDEPHRTLRERMKVTQETYCWKCHQQMNPLGMPFEMYDHFGRYRTAESVVDPSAPMTKGKKKGDEAVSGRKNVALNATGTIKNSGDPRLEGDVPNALAMIRKLAESPRARQVFVRHAFRYWMGRNETLDDGPTLAAADRAYCERGGSMKALITSLLMSDSFLYRKRL